jgi:hypothetical protein
VGVAVGVAVDDFEDEAEWEVGPAPRTVVGGVRVRPCEAREADRWPLHDIHDKTGAFQPPPRRRDVVGKESSLMSCCSSSHPPRPCPPQNNSDGRQQWVASWLLSWS